MLSALPQLLCFKMLVISTLAVPLIWPGRLPP
jgi:hypothetical protein